MCIWVVLNSIWTWSSWLLWRNWFWNVLQSNSRKSWMDFRWLPLSLPFIPLDISKFLSSRNMWCIADLTDNWHRISNMWYNIAARTHFHRSHGSSDSDRDDKLSIRLIMSLMHYIRTGEKFRIVQKKVVFGISYSFSLFVSDCFFFSFLIGHISTRPASVESYSHRRYPLLFVGSPIPT